MKIACIIPHYNHPKTVIEVAAGAKRHLDDVRVFDDGSTDLPADFEAELAKLKVKLLRHERNQGKGSVIRHAGKILADEGVDSMIIMDADGCDFGYA